MSTLLCRSESHEIKIEKTKKEHIKMGDPKLYVYDFMLYNKDSKFN